MYGTLRGIRVSLNAREFGKQAAGRFACKIRAANLWQTSTKFVAVRTIEGERARRPKMDTKSLSNSRKEIGFPR